MSDGPGVKWLCQQLYLSQTGRGLKDSLFCTQRPSSRKSRLPPHPFCCLSPVSSPSYSLLCRGPWLCLWEVTVGGPCLQSLVHAAWCSHSPSWQAVPNRSRFAHNIRTVWSLTRNWAVLTHPGGAQGSALLKSLLTSGTISTP